MSLLKGTKVYISDQKAHDAMLKQYVDEVWAEKDVKVDWEWSGPGVYRIHEHVDGGLPCISLKWEDV